MKTNTLNNNSELIPEQWYIIYFSNKLKKKPVTIKRLGIDLVLWRDQTGSARCARAACPHRGADLGLGEVVNGELQCKYHGFCFSGNGSCTTVPCQGKDAAIPNTLNLKMFDIIEDNGFIWFWYSPTKQKPTSEIPHIDGEFALDKNTLSVDFTWDVKLSRVVEGMMDLHHIPFAHKTWLPTSCTKLDPYEVSVERDIVYTKGILVDEDNPKKKGMAGLMNIAFPGYINMAFGFHDPKTNDTKYGYDIIGALTPIDETSTWVAVYYRQSYVTLPLVSQIFNYLAIQFDLKLIQPDDYLLLKSSEPQSSGLRANHLVGADRGIAEWHRIRERILEQKEVELNAQTKVQEARGEKETANIGSCLS